MIKIIKASLQNLKDIMKIYEYARQFMKKTNNPNQWGENEPTIERIKNYILEDNFYIGINENNEILFSFAFIIGEDCTYKYIENGKWNDESNYGTIHSLASNGKIKHVFSYCLSFCLLKINHIRIDTHEDNKIMQKILVKNGFKKSGVIYLSNGSPRLAYELTLD